MTVQDIRALFKNAAFEDLPALCKSYAQDHRSSVRALTEKYERWHNIESERLQQLWDFELSVLGGRPYAVVCGFDEAGAGPLAGPLVGCALALPRGLTIAGINDSKKLNPQKREALADVIKDKALACSVVIIDNDEIDEINIFRARMAAISRAVNGLEHVDFALIDGTHAPRLPIPHVCITNGDALTISIAAASIIAKTTRDNIMQAYHGIYPQYGFDKHKGYGTKRHYEAIEQHGILPIHRKTFL